MPLNVNVALTWEGTAAEALEGVFGDDDRHRICRERVIRQCLRRYIRVVAGQGYDGVESAAGGVDRGTVAGERGCRVKLLVGRQRRGPGGVAGAAEAVVGSRRHPVVVCEGLGVAIGVGHRQGKREIRRRFLSSAPLESELVGVSGRHVRRVAAQPRGAPTVGGDRGADNLRFQIDPAAEAAIVSGKLADARHQDDPIVIVEYVDREKREAVLTWPGRVTDGRVGRRAGQRGAAGDSGREGRWELNGS